MQSQQSEVYQNFTSFLSMKRASNETFKNFESRFVAQVSKFNMNSSSSEVPEALTAFILFATSAVENGQSISVLAAASIGTPLDASATTDEYLPTVSHEKVASVLRQCNQVKSDASPSVNVNAVNTEPTKRQGGRNGNVKHRMTPAQIAQYKGKSKCHLCHKYGHFRSNHEDDGTLKPGTWCSETPVPGDDTTKFRKTITFNMTKLVDDESFDECFVGPLLDDSALYSGMGYVVQFIVQ